MAHQQTMGFNDTFIFNNENLIFNYFLLSHDNPFFNNSFVVGIEM